MYEYKVTFKRGAASDTFIVDSHINPASLILDVHAGYSYGDYEYVQECLTVLQSLARRRYDFSPRQAFMHVTLPDGTVVEPT
jgi:hypothetical protein